MGEDMRGLAMIAVVASLWLAACGQKSDTSNESAGALTPEEEGAAANAAAAAAAETPPEAWWIASADFTKCHDGGSPGSQIKSLRDNGEEASNHEYRDANGEITSVEVTAPLPDGRETVWTFYAQKSDCEAAAAKQSGSAPELQ
jgi:hypothetical protein